MTQSTTQDRLEQPFTRSSLGFLHLGPLDINPSVGAFKSDTRVPLLRRLLLLVVLLLWLGRVELLSLLLGEDIPASVLIPDHLLG